MTGDGATTPTGGRTGSLLAGSLFLLAALAGPEAARAQEEIGPGWSADARAGVALPAGELAGVAEPGPTLGVGAAYWLGSRVALRGDVSLDLYNEAEPFGPFEQEGPDLRAWHTTAGVIVRFTEEDDPRLTTDLGAGLGAVSFDGDRFLVPATDRTEPTSFEQTYLTPYASARVGYELSDRARLHAEFRATLILADEEDTRVFEAATGGRVQRFDTAGRLPFTVGVSWRL